MNIIYLYVLQYFEPEAAGTRLLMYPFSCHLLAPSTSNSCTYVCLNVKYTYIYKKVYIHAPFSLPCSDAMKKNLTTDACMHLCSAIYIIWTGYTHAWKCQDFKRIEKKEKKKIVLLENKSRRDKVWIDCGTWCGRQVQIYMLKTSSIINSSTQYIFYFSDFIIFSLLRSCYVLYIRKG